MNEASTPHSILSDGSLIVRTQRVPWAPWALPKTWFKLLDYDRDNAYTSTLLWIDPQSPPTAHKHVGAANAYILQGGFSYEHGVVRAGDYLAESGGVVHTPTPHEDGCMMLAFFNGPLAGVNADGSTADLIDPDWMIDQAHAYGAFDHLAKAVRT